MKNNIIIHEVVIDEPTEIPKQNQSGRQLNNRDHKRSVC